MEPLCQPTCVLLLPPTHSHSLCAQQAEEKSGRGRGGGVGGGGSVGVGGGS